MLVLKPFDANSINSVLDFSNANPWKPLWSEDLKLRFLTQLISSNQNVLDVFDGNKRVGIAVLLDKIKNKGNNAALEILGIHGKSDHKEVLQKIIIEAKTRLSQSFSGIEFTFQLDLLSLQTLVSQNDLSPYYFTCEMQHENLNTAPQSTNSDIFLAAHNEDKKVYEVLVDSFKENVDTSIPPFALWKEGRENSAWSKTWVLKKESGICGFIHLLIPEYDEPEIRTVGVLSAYRRRGYGKDLILHALDYLKSISKNSCLLTVAVQNAGALGLYENLGFKEKSRLAVYRWVHPNHI